MLNDTITINNFINIKLNVIIIRRDCIISGMFGQITRLFLYNYHQVFNSELNWLKLLD